MPLYTAKLSAASGGYGIITEVYSYVALLLVLLTFGMETTFFRFVNKEEEEPMRVYSTTLLTIGLVGLAFIAAVMGFLKEKSREPPQKTAAHGCYTTCPWRASKAENSLKKPC